MKNTIILLLATTLFFFLMGCVPRKSKPLSTNLLSDDQLAHDILVKFLETLHKGSYAEAAQQYGGSYETMIDQNPALDPNDRAALLRNACTVNSMQCLQAKSAVLDKKVSDTEFVFKVDFIQDDGTLFVLGPCCGGDEMNTPPQSEFHLRVVKIAGDKFTVINTPPYAP
jgi:hypothetical protein